MPVVATDRLDTALRSLIAQSADDFAIVVVDDSCGTSVERIVRVIGDPRVTYVANERRLGLAANWRHSRELARELYPGHRYFAWGSDHDVWEPGWLSALRHELDAHPEAVLAYSLCGRIPDSAERPWRFDTGFDPSPRSRFATTIRRMVAGDMVYGLFRADALATCDVFPPVLLPDRLLLAELSRCGTFRQVDSILWHRRTPPDPRSTIARQRARLFTGRPPAHARIPWQVTHGVLIGRRLGPTAGLAYAILSALFPLGRRVRPGSTRAA